MIFELTAAWNTIRKEGLGSLFNKLRIYFAQRRAFADFRAAPRPAPQPEAVVDFAWTVADGLIRPFQVKPELVSLCRLVAETKPRVVVEIGTASGGTLFCWNALADPEAAIISLDLPNGIHGGGYPRWKRALYQTFAGPRQKLHLLRGDSHSPAMLQRLQALLPGRVDFLFIDGDHTYAGVKQDYETYAPLVKPGGLIVFHDICLHPPELDCHVDELWNEVKQGREYREIIEDPKQGICGIGVLKAR